jgi:vitamin B12 transporter
LTTQQGAIFIIQAERFLDRGAGMQRALVVGMSLVCLSIVGMIGGWVSSGGERTVWKAAAAEPMRLDPVVVTGTQIAVPVSELPSAMTVIERKEIENRQITDVPQLLRTVPGLSVTQIGSRGGLTDIFPRGGNANFNLVLVDGVPVNNAGGRYDFSDLTTDNIERIEIIRGPQSALYGSNAIGSVIQIFTRRGEGRSRQTSRSLAAASTRLKAMERSAAARSASGARLA